MAYGNGKKTEMKRLSIDSQFKSFYSICLPPSEENGPLSQRSRLYSLLNKTRFHLQPGAAERRNLTPDGYASHAQQYRFFTRPAVRTGLLWKIPLNLIIKKKVFWISLYSLYKKWRKNMNLEKYIIFFVYKMLWMYVYTAIV